MAQPPAYTPADFTSLEWNENRLADLDAEWAKIQAFADVVVTNLAKIQRDDTKLANASVHKDALSSEALALFATAWNPRGAWVTATEYAKLDAVSESGNAYICVEAHTSGTFATDLAADKWLFVGSENVYATDADIAAAYASEVAAASKAEAEAGTETAIRRWSPLRIGQAAKKLASGKQTIWVPASAMTPTTTNGCAALATVEYQAGDVGLNVLDFDGAAGEAAFFQIAMPKGWNEGQVSFQLFWITTASDTDDVLFSLQGRALSDNESPAQTFTGVASVTDAAQGAANRVLVSTESSGLTLNGPPAEGDLCTFRLFRQPAFDTMDEDARVIGIKLFFTTNAATDD